ncbi:MAG: peptidylprolyl isomerase [Pseudomonadota bacterium]
MTKISVLKTALLLSVGVATANADINLGGLFSSNKDAVSEKSSDSKESPAESSVSSKKEEPKIESATDDSKSEEKKPEEKKPEEKKSEEKKHDTKSGALDLSDMNRAVATFSDGTIIKFQEVQDLLMQLPAKLRDAPFSKLYASLLNRLVDSKVLLDAATKGAFDKDAEVIKRISDAKELLLQKAYLDQEIDKLITDSILRGKYEELLKLLPKDEMESDVCHILFEKKEDAEKALKELSSAGRNLETRFNEMVVAKSADTSTKANKGNIGWVRKADIKNEELFKAAKGTMVPQVLKIFDQGYSVFFIRDRRPIQPPEFDKIKAEIKKAITPQYAITVVDKMRRDAGLQITGLDGKPMPLPDLPPMPDASGKEPEKKTPEKKDFSGVNEKALDNSMVVGVFTNGEKITLGQVRDSLASIPEQLKATPFHQLFEPLVLRVADTKLLIEAAKKANLEKSADLIKKQEEVQKGLLQRAYLDKQFAQVITPAMLKEAYQEFLKIFPKDDMEIRIRHIMVATKEEAEAILKDLKGGKAKFDNEYVKEKTIDPNTKESGGDLGYIPKKQLPSDLADVLFKAPKATLIPEPVTLGDNGFSVIRVEDKRAVQAPTIEDIRPQLTQAVSQREAAKIVMKLREDSKVVLRDMDGNIMSTAPAPTAK